MQIVIIGAGEVGFHAAKALSESKHDTKNSTIIHDQFKSEFYISFTDFIIEIKR